MPRRRGDAARAQALREAEARWRYRLRHPEFQRELNDLLALGFPPDKLALFEAKWDVRIPFALRRPGSPSRLDAETLPEFERLFVPCVMDLPVAEVLDVPEEPSQAVRELSLEEIADIAADPEAVQRAFFEGERASRTLYLAIRLDYPLDVLMALVQKEIRQAQAFQLDPVPRRERRRLDKVNLHLQVYDRALRGETFTAIAKALRRPVSTIKSLWVAARRRIFAPDVSPPSREAILRSQFDPDTHFKTCAVCRAADTADALCPVARAAVETDTRSRRELLVKDFDRVSDLLQAPPSVRARRRPPSPPND